MKDQSTMHISELSLSHFKTMNPTQDNAIKVLCNNVPQFILNQKLRIVNFFTFIQNQLIRPL
jgi:hypothetical protein